MLKYGFYNSVNGDRTYEADDMGRLFNGIIKDGVFYSIGDKFRVTPAGGMYVSVGTGRAWFNGTWSDLDAEMLFEVPTSSVIRTYFVTLIIDKRTGATQRKNSIELLTVSEWNAKQDIANLYTYRLATIDVPANPTVIQSSMITNHVGGDAEPVIPWVIGAVQSLDLSSEITYWESQMNDAIDTAISNYFSGMVVAQKPADLGGGYTMCSTASATLAKTAIIQDFIPTDGGIFCIRFTEDVPSYATLNISDGDSWTGAKEIYHKNARILSGVITANRIGTFVFDEVTDTYRLISVDDADAGSTPTWNDVKPSGGVPKTDLASGVQSSLDAADAAYDNVVYATVTNLQADITPGIIYTALVTNQKNILYCLFDTVTKGVYILNEKPTSSSEAEFVGFDRTNNAIVLASMNSTGGISYTSVPVGGSTPSWNDIKPSGGVPASDLADDAKPMVVAITGSISGGTATYTASEDYADIETALTAGQVVMAKHAGKWYYCVGDPLDDEAVFVRPYASGTSSQGLDCFIIDDQDTVSRLTRDLDVKAFPVEFYIGGSPTGPQCYATFAQISAAVQAGKRVDPSFSDLFGKMTAIDASKATFYFIDQSGSVPTWYIFVVDSTDAITLTQRVLGDAKAPTFVTESSATPSSLAAADNTIYKYTAAALTSLTISSIPANGEFVIKFVSGSTATTLTTPATMHMPDDFTAIEANKRYEISVSDGYAVVASWAVSA